MVLDDDVEESRCWRKGGNGGIDVWCRGMVGNGSIVIEEFPSLSPVGIGAMDVEGFALVPVGGTGSIELVEFPRRGIAGNGRIVVD